MPCKYLVSGLHYPTNRNASSSSVQSFGGLCWAKYTLPCTHQRKCIHGFLSIRVEYKTGDSVMLASTLMIVPEKPGSAHTFTFFDLPNFPLAGSKLSPLSALKAFPARLAKLAMKVLLQWSTIPEEAIRHINGGFDVANQVCTQMSSPPVLSAMPSEAFGASGLMSVIGMTCG